MLRTVKQEYADLKSGFRLFYDNDPWGQAVHWHFTIADELYAREGYTPDHWRYHPSPLGPTNDPDDYVTQHAIEVGADTLHNFGNLLHRYCRLLRHIGKDY